MIPQLARSAFTGASDKILRDRERLRVAWCKHLGFWPYSLLNSSAGPAPKLFELNERYLFREKKKENKSYFGGGCEKHNYDIL